MLSSTFAAPESPCIRCVIKSPITGEAGTNGDVGRPRDEDDVRALREEPRECDLARGHAVRFAHALEPRDKLEDAREGKFSLVLA